MTCKGENTPERPHRLALPLAIPERPEVVSCELLEEVARPTTALPPRAKKRPLDLPVVPPEHRALVVERATKYVAQMPAAIEGKGGDKATFTVVCVLENDFALSLEDAWPILMKYYDRCLPPWDECDLERKWMYSQLTSKGRRGDKLPSDIRHALRPQAAGSSPPAATTSAEGSRSIPGANANA
jgi:hypothetical protein